MRFFQNTLITMDDGIRLAADIYLPDEDARYPAVLYMGPYRKDDWILTHGSVSGFPEIYTARGYAVIIADVRGTNDSEGHSHVMFSYREQEDGAFLVEWVAAQDWSDGNVGLTGVSYGFYTTLLTAAQQPPHLKTIVPLNGGVSWQYCSGENGLQMALGFQANYVALQLSMMGAPPGFQDEAGLWREIWEKRLENLPGWGLDWLAYPPGDAYWDEASVETKYDKINVPVFTIGGWWDRYPSDSLMIADAVKGPTKILLGPWQHMRPDAGIPGPRVDYDIVLRWFDYWLKDIDNGIMDEPLFSYYEQRYGEPAEYRHEIPGNWRKESWPIEGASILSMHLHSDGSLKEDLEATKSYKEYRYDPTIGACMNLDGGIYGGIGMPVDQRPDEKGSLTYTTTPLESEVVVTGIPKIRLQFSSSARVMGVFVKLCDVAPDGTVALITRGQLNACFRQGLDDPQWLIPNEVTELNFDIKATAYVFEPGHCIRISITSGGFPSVMPTPESGTNRIHSRSFIELPVLPASRNEDEETLRIKPMESPSEERPKGVDIEFARNEETGEVLATLSMHSRFRNVAGWVDHCQETRSTVLKDNPAASVFESVSTYTMEYDTGECVRSIGTIRCEGQPELMKLEASLQVMQDADEHVIRNWAYEYPRLFY